MNVNEKFSNLVQFSEAISRLDKPGFQDVYVGDSEDSEEKFQAVVGEDGQVYSIVSGRYHIMQSRDILRSVSAALSELGVHDVEGSIIEQDGKTFARVLLPVFISEGNRQKGQDIRLGFMLRNSYDGKKSISISGFAMRLVCTNGMVVPRTLGHETVRKHIASYEKDIVKAVGSLISEMVDRSEKLRSAIDSAIADMMDEVNVELLLGEYGFGTKEVMDEIKLRLTEGLKSGKVSRWDVYNAITNLWAFRNVKEHTRVEKLRKAEKLLVKAEVRQHA